LHAAPIIFQFFVCDKDVLELAAQGIRIGFSTGETIVIVCDFDSRR
jgi:hypothetical protein